jgi:hypothetical protein
MHPNCAGCTVSKLTNGGAVQEAYAGLREVDGGEVKVEALQLCRMAVRPHACWLHLSWVREFWSSRSPPKVIEQHMAGKGRQKNGGHRAWPTVDWQRTAFIEVIASAISNAILNCILSRDV